MIIGLKPPSEFRSCKNFDPAAPCRPTSAASVVTLIGVFVVVAVDGSVRLLESTDLSAARGSARADQSEVNTSELGTKALSWAPKETNCSKMFFFCSKFFRIVSMAVDESFSGAAAWIPLVNSSTISLMAGLSVVPPTSTLPSVVVITVAGGKVVMVRLTGGWVAGGGGGALWLLISGADRVSRLSTTTMGASSVDSTTSCCWVVVVAGSGLWVSRSCVPVFRVVVASLSSWPPLFVVVMSVAWGSRTEVLGRTVGISVRGMVVAVVVVVVVVSELEGEDVETVTRGMRGLMGFLTFSTVFSEKMYS